MVSIANAIQLLLPLCSLIILIWGLLKKNRHYFLSAFWLSLISLITHYQNSGGNIFGDYFSYYTTILCSFSLLLVVSITSHFISYSTQHQQISIKNYLAPLIQAAILLAGVMLLVNLWLNAYFLSNKLQGTPIIQVALMEKPSYCNYKYIFYKITKTGATDYLCPNYYGFFPKIGHLSLSPDFITRQLSLPNKRQLLLLQKKR